MFYAGGPGGTAALVFAAFLVILGALIAIEKIRLQRVKSARIIGFGVR